MIYITLQSVRKSAKAATIKQVRSFKKCNVDNLLNDMVKAPWDVIDTFNDADDKWGYWKALFFDIIDRHSEDEMPAA